MKYEIECYIDSIDSDGNFTFRGSEGHCIEKEGKIYNVFWKEDGGSVGAEIQLVAYAQNELKLNAKEQKKFQLLATALASSRKVLFEIDFEHKKKVTKVTLL